MESLVRSIRTLQRRLQEADIPSIVIGGVAIALWGEPRVTRDILELEWLNRPPFDKLRANG
jgi:hypothetical protein